MNSRREVPVLRIPSFDVMSEPIVESPVQASRCFYSIVLDGLVLGDYVIEE
jgi:carbamoyltransferase